MGPVFEIVDTQSSTLWDYGWFDRTRFRVHGFLNDPTDSTAVLSALIGSTHYARSFCTPAPWGAADREHGPIALEALTVSAFRPISHDELVRRVNAVLADPQFSASPSEEQMAAIQAWLTDTRRPGLELFALEPPDEAAGSLAAMGIWILFHEYVAVDLSSSEISVGVIGYD